MISFAHSGHDHGAELTQAVATNSTSADIAYVVCIVSFFVAALLAIYLLWDKARSHTATAKKAKVVRPTKTAKKATKKPARKTTKK